MILKVCYFVLFVFGEGKVEVVVGVVEGLFLVLFFGFVI